MERRRWEAMLLLSALFALAACDQFGTQGMVETCVRNAMKETGPFASDKERSDTEAQLKDSCTKAAAARR